jgi:hypothetical protein
MSIEEGKEMRYRQWLTSIYSLRRGGENGPHHLQGFQQGVRLILV